MALAQRRLKESPQWENTKSQYRNWKDRVHEIEAKRNAGIDFGRAKAEGISAWDAHLVRQLVAVDPRVKYIKGLYEFLGLLIACTVLREFAVLFGARKDIAKRCGISPGSFRRIRIQLAKLAWLEKDPVFSVIPCVDRDGIERRNPQKTNSYMLGPAFHDAWKRAGLVALVSSKRPTVEEQLFSHHSSDDRTRTCDQPPDGKGRKPCAPAASTSSTSARDVGSVPPAPTATATSTAAEHGVVDVAELAAAAGTATSPATSSTASAAATPPEAFDVDAERRRRDAECLAQRKRSRVKAGAIPVPPGRSRRQVVLERVRASESQAAALLGQNGETAAKFSNALMEMGDQTDHPRLVLAFSGSPATATRPASFPVSSGPDSDRSEGAPFGRADCPRRWPPPACPDADDVADRILAARRLERAGIAGNGPASTLVAEHQAGCGCRDCAIASYKRVFDTDELPPWLR